MCASLTILEDENYSRQTISFTADESGPLQKTMGIPAVGMI